jgi:hypothetical protein
MEYKSNEEYFFSLWLDELKANGYIERYEYEPEAIPLSSKLCRNIGKKEQFVLHPHEYTYDFMIKWEPKAIGIFATIFESDVKSNTPLYCDVFLTSAIEIKPEFDFKNMTREVMINIKWAYDKHGIYINLVKPPSFFKKSFTPAQFLSTKTKKPRKIKYTPILTLEEYVQQGKIKKA